jgi:hypothetical protein
MYIFVDLALAFGGFYPNTTPRGRGPKYKFKYRRYAQKSENSATKKHSSARLGKLACIGRNISVFAGCAMLVALE